MADISDIVLRIRVDIVNTKAIQGLVNSLAQATTAVRTHSRAQFDAQTAATRATMAAERLAERRQATEARAAAASQRILDRAAAAEARAVARRKREADAAERAAKRAAAIEQRAFERAERLRQREARAAERLAAAKVRASERATRAREREVAAAQRAADRTAAAAKREATAISRAFARAIAIKVREAQRAQREVERAAEREARAQVRAAREAERSARMTERANQKSAEAMRKAAAAARALYEENRRLYSMSALVAKAQGKVAAAFSKIVEPLSRVERKMDAVFRAGVHMQSMGRDLLNFAKKVVGFGKQMLDSWGDFEFTLNRAAAAAGIFGNTTPMYEELKDAVYLASKELRMFPAEEVAKAVYFWQSTTGDAIEGTKDLEATMKNVTAVMKLAAMTDSNYETAIKGVYSTLKQFNMTTKETADVSALLYFATQKTALEFPDLINAFKMTGAVMGQAEEPLTSMVAVLGAVGNAGFRGSQAGRALRQTYIKVVKPTKAAKEELNKLFKAQGGYNKVAFDSKGNFVGMEKYMMRMAKATQHMTYKQRAHLLATITTANELPVMTQMLRMAERAVRAGDKSWTEFIVSQEKANEVFSESWNTISNSWRGVVGGLKQSLQPILLEVGGIIAKMLTPTLQELSDTIWEMGPVIEDMAKGLAETFRPFVEWVGKAIGKVMVWARANQKVVAAFAKYGVIAAIIAGVGGAFLMLAGTVTLLIANLAIVLLGALPLIAVFVALGVALAALTVGFYRNTGGIKDALLRLWEAIKRVFNIWMNGSEDVGVTAESLADSFMRLSESITKKFSDIVNWIAGALEKLTPQQVDIIKKLVKALIGLKLLNSGLGLTVGIIRNLTGNISLMAGEMKKATPKIIDFLKAFNPKNIKKAIDGMNDLAQTVYIRMLQIDGAMKKGVAKGTGAAEAGLDVALKFVGGIVGGLAGAAATAVAAVVGWPVIIIAAIVAAVVAAIAAAYATNFFGFKDFIDGIVKWFTDVAVPAVVGFGEGIVKAFGDGLAGLGTWIGEVIAWFGRLPAEVGTLIGTFVAGVVTKFNEIITWFQNLPGRITTFIGQVIANLGTFVSEIGVKIGEALAWFGENWDEALGYVLGRIVAFPLSVLIEIGKFALDLGTAIGTMLGDFFNSFSFWLGETIGFVIGWFATNIPLVITEAGKFIGGIIDWVAKLPGRVAEFFGTVWTNVTTWFATNIPLVIAEATKFVTGIADWFAKLPGKVAEFFTGVWTNVSSWFTVHIALVAVEASKFITGITDWFKKLPGKIAEFFSTVWTNITTWFVTNVPLVILEASKFINGILQFFKDLPGNIVIALQDLPTTLKNIFINLGKAAGDFIKAVIEFGKDIVRGIWKGIEAMVGWLTDKVGGFLGGFVDGIKDQLGIQSPSKVFAGIGDQMIAGLAKGIAASDAANVAMTGVITGLTGSVADASLALSSNVGGTFKQAVTQDTTKTIKLEVDVTSADGSVNTMDMTTLAGLITGSDMTRTLERMSTVD